MVQKEVTLKQATEMLKNAKSADGFGKNPEMRARNHDQILSWIEDKVFTWQEIGITASSFEALLMRMVDRCPECNKDRFFLCWLKSDLKCRCYNIENNMSQRGSAMTTVVQFPKAA